MKSFSDKTNIGENNPLKTIYRMNFYLLFLLIGSLSILGSTRAYCQQSRTISGIVKNSQGETVIGANIVEKGTSNGTITNVDGLFTLRISPNAILKVSYMGYTEQEVNTRNKNKLEIILTEDARLIDEVVVVGYGSVKKRDLTGAVTSVKSAEVLAAPTNNVMEALQGKIPGMDITKTSGQVGGDVTILLRGSRSIYGSNEPLFIIDGIPGSYSLFTLRISPNAILKVSYMGYTEQEVNTRNKNKLEIILTEDARLIDEVVVVGYGSVKKRDLTGAVTSVKSAEVLAAPTNNVMEALQGKIPGMDITKTSGQVGGDVTILLRGSRSIYGSNEPLFIIDGIPGSYSQVSPSDIESVDVLKDASSTAIYGSAGANGVVIITTKRGKEGNATVNFDAYYGFSGSPNYRHGMTRDEWVTYQQEAYKYKNGDYPTDMSALLGKQDFIDAYNDGKWIDWIDEVSGNTATTQKYSLSVSSGTEKTKLFASTSYNREEGLLNNENLNRYSLRLNLDQQIFSWAKVGFTSN